MIALARLPGAFRFWCAENFFAAPFSLMSHGFEPLSRAIERHAAQHTDKRDAPLLFAGAFADGVTSKSAAGLDWSRFPPFALVDLDGATALTTTEVVAAVARALPRVRVDLWTTHSHGSTKGTRMRALVALSRGPATPDEFSAVWSALNAKAGLLGALGPDQVVHDATRGHAWPSAPVDSTPEYHRLPGRALDADALATFGRSLPATLPRSTPARARADRPADVPWHELTRADLLGYWAHAKRLSKPTLPAVEAVLRGRPVAPQGKRYTAMRDLLASLWHWVRREHGAWLDPDSLWETFGATCEAMAGTSDVEPDERWLADLLSSYAPKGEARVQETLRTARAALIGGSPVQAA